MVHFACYSSLGLSDSVWGRSLSVVATEILPSVTKDYMSILLFFANRIKLRIGPLSLAENYTQPTSDVP